jgi:predicted RNase H-like HicB family nuclease
MKTLTYRTIILKDDEGYHGFVPALAGCHTYGDTFEEVKSHLQEAITAWIESRKENGWGI